MTEVMNYGGGRQTVAMCLLVAMEKLPEPDRIVIADTGREARSTWEYLDEYVQPLMASVGLTVEIAPHSLATVDLYSHKGTLLMPVFTETGKFSTYCSGEWKTCVVQRYLRAKGIKSATSWIGFTTDEPKRIRNLFESSKTKGAWRVRCPLAELMLTRLDCEKLILRHGWPLPPKSACFMCPHRSNEEWRFIRDNYPDQWQEAIKIDCEIREEDEFNAVYLHHSRVPLDQADLDAIDRKEPDRQCGLGLCMI